MKVLAQAELLKDALNKVLTVVDKKSSRPILTNCLISAENHLLSISATDLEVSAKVIIETEVESPGKFCINAKNISDILREMPNEVISLEIDEKLNLLKLKCQQIDFSLVIVNSDDFPPLVFQNTSNEFSLNSVDIQKIIAMTSHAISTDETRLFLNGIYLQNRESRLRAVAIDGHRLALLSIANEIPENRTLSDGIIIPRKGVNELKKLADSFPNDELKISVDESFLYASANSKYFLSVRLIAREYPNYEAIIPSKTAFNMVVEKEPFLTAIKRIKILASEKSNGVRLSLSKNQLTLSANHPSLGNAKETLEISYDGKEMEIGFNAKYLIDTLSVLNDSEIIFGFNNELSPILIKSKISPEFLGIIMPVKL